MDQHALHVLEYSKVKDILAGFTASGLGRDAVGELHPFTAIETIRYELCEVTEMVRLLDAGQQPPLDGLYDVREPLNKSTVPGAVLESAEILLTGETVAAARRIRNSLRKMQVDAPHIRRYADRIAPHPEIEKALDRVFDEQKAIRDTASRELSKIRKSIHSHRGSLVKRIERFMRKSWKDYLQESYYTNREGRYVLPIDARYQNKVKGIIHDRSSTGTTVFIEPLELVEEGNRLKELQREEEIEIRKILRELTAMLAERYDDLTNNLIQFRQLDFITAKARFSVKYEMNEPKLREDGVLSIVRAVHPLLLAQHGREKVVPFTLTMPETSRGLIVTGPNTGGKTVLLKSVGLLILMAQSGMHVSADITTELPVFQSIGADIGDEQSLEQSLSTFSSHMRNIRAILANSGKNSLVLLDELGSGTDPAEGGALSCAILQQLHDQDAHYLVTTHLQELKLFAYKTDGVENGSMEFDLESLHPTFAFLMGLPGKSNAIKIAARLGLPEPIIKRAESDLTKQGDSPEDLLLRLGDELREAQTLRDETQQELRETENLRGETERRLKNAKEEAREVIRRSERKAQNLIHGLESRLREMERQESEFQRQWKEQLASLPKQQAPPVVKPPSPVKKIRDDVQEAKRQAIAVQAAEEEQYIERRHWRWNQIAPGVRVRIHGMSEPGEVMQAWKEKNQVEVAVSTMTLKIGSKRIAAILDPKPKPRIEKLTDVQVDRPDRIDHQVDIHGMTVEEMTPIVQKFIDQAFLAGLSSVLIVHGHGFGVLRRTVRSMLKDNPVVIDCANGMDAEGGTGVTVVRLKQSM